MSLGDIGTFAVIGAVFLGTGVVVFVWGIQKWITEKKAKVFCVGLLLALIGLLLLVIANQASSSV